MCPQHQHSCAGRVFLESVHAELYSDLGLLLVFLGAVLALQFLYYEVAMLKNPSGRSLGLQVFVALASSSFLGRGLGDFGVLLRRVPYGPGVLEEQGVLRAAGDEAARSPGVRARLAGDRHAILSAMAWVPLRELLQLRAHKGQLTPEGRQTSDDLPVQQLVDKYFGQMLRASSRKLFFYDPASDVVCQRHYCRIAYRDFHTTELRTPPLHVCMDSTVLGFSSTTSLHNVEDEEKF
ncbi:unnamed protein product [Symbiodinium sp. CCMP2456]|nr:unnamed protein product [Symbiodinium sp. CCMP2456]